MSRYTTELRFLLENPEWTDERLGLTQYEIFSEEKRADLNQKIKDHFMFDEIGILPPARWAQRMKNRMNVIMRYYNQLYITENDKIEPFLTKRVHEASDENADRILHFIGKADSKYNATHIDDDKQDNTYGRTKEYAGSTENVRTGVETDEKSGTRTNTKSGSEVDTGKKGNLYEHGLTVNSDTPEGFIETDTIEHDTYASTAQKYRKRTEQESEDVNTKIYKDVKDTENFNNYTDTKTYKDVTDTATYKGRIDTDGGKDTIKVDNTKTDNSTSNTTNDNSETTNNSVLIDRWVDGFDGTSMSDLLKKWRDTLINIDQRILADLEVLFIQVMN